MIVKRAWRGRRDDRGERAIGPRLRSERRRWEPAAYWLLYVVALLAALFHWHAGNEFLAALCALTVLVSIRCIMRAHREGESAV